MKTAKSTILLFLATTALHAQEADLAQKLANPISDLISLPTKTTLSLNTETTYDWSNEEWTVPLNFQIAQLFKVGDQPMQAFIGARYYAEKPDNGPEWGLRFGLTFLFPKS